MASYSRIDRISEEIKKELSNIIRELKDPRIPQLVSVVNVEVTKDLSYAKAYISVLGSEQEGQDTIAGLKRAEGFIRSQLAKNMNLRNTPEIQFILDQSIAYGVNMTKKIEELAGEEHEED